MKEIIIDESLEKTRKRLSKSLEKTNALSRFEFGADGKFFGKFKADKATVFCKNRYVFSVFGTTLKLKLCKSGSRTRATYYFARPVISGIFVGIAAIFICAAGAFLLNEDPFFAIPLFALGAALGTSLFVFPKKKKAQLEKFLKK